MDCLPYLESLGDLPHFVRLISGSLPEARFATLRVSHLLLLAGGAHAKQRLSRSCAAGGHFFCLADLPYESELSTAGPLNRNASLVRCELLDNLCFAERGRFELPIPFWGIHAFQACLLSHSSISPITPFRQKRSANIQKIR